MGKKNTQKCETKDIDLNDIFKNINKKKTEIKEKIVKEKAKVKAEKEK